MKLLHTHPLKALPSAALTIVAAALWMPYQASVAHETGSPHADVHGTTSDLNKGNAITHDSVLTNKAVAITAADTRNEAVFRAVPAVGLSSSNSHLMVSADEGIWKQSKGLPLGSKILMSMSSVNVPADGKSYTRVRVQVFDKNMQKIVSPPGEAITVLLETSLGRFQVPGLATSTSSEMPKGNTAGGNDKTSPMGQPTTELTAVQASLVNGEAQIVLMSPATPGTAVVRVSSGAVGVQGEVSFSPDLRPLIVVGLIEGTIHGSKVVKDANAPEILNTAFEDSLRNWTRTQTNSNGDHERTIAGRVAFFAKGAVKGDYLLTLAVDSDKVTKDQLFKDIDPNAFYPIYGDASVKSQDAQSKSRIFVRIDKNKSYALFGDFSTGGDSGSSLASYNRSLTGVQWHYEQPSIKLNVFAANDSLRSFVEEQAGLGISGPYTVGKPNAVANSEQVTIIVRDKAQPAVVLKTTQLTRFVDYDFEPFSGRILFRQPVPRADENLNPVSIRIVYELDEGGEKFWVGGIDAKIKVSENATVGAVYATDKNPTAPYTIMGLNTAIKLGQRTYFTAELAKSTATQHYNQSITPLTLGTSTAVGTEQTGQAVKVELRHDGDRLQTRLAYAKSDANFQNTGGGLSGGRQELSARASYAVSPKVSLNADASQTQDNTGAGSATHGSKRDAYSLGAGIRLSDKVNLDVGINHSKQHVVGGSAGMIRPIDSTVSTNNGFGFNGTGLLNTTTSSGLSAPVATQVLADDSYTSLNAKLTVKVSENVSLYGEYERANDDRQRTAVGGEYRINPKTRLYAKHEFADSLASGYGLNSGVKVTNTVLGLDTAYMQDGQIFSEYRLAGAQAGRDAAAAIGVRNLWKLPKGIQATTSIERQHIMDAAGVARNATAVAVGAEYNEDPMYRVGGKLEVRHSEAQDQLLSTIAITRKMSDDWSALARNLYMKTKGHTAELGTVTQDRLQFGMAYRDSKTNRFHGLARLEYRSDATTASANPSDVKTTAASLHGNYHPSRAWTWAGQLAAKQVNETLGANAIQSKWSGSLVSGRVIWDFADRFDASVFASMQRGGASKFNGLGAELGYRLKDNLWLSGGYTGGKFSDSELFTSNASRTGWHLRLRYSFDEKALSTNDPRVNRTLDTAADGVDKSPRQWRE